MKKIAVAILSALILSSGFAQAHEVIEVACESDHNIGHKWAKMRLQDYQIHIVANVGYHNFTLLCSYYDNCVGFEFGSSAIAEGRAHVNRDEKQKITGFEFDDYKFKCVVP